MASRITNRPQASLQLVSLVVALAIVSMAGQSSAFEFVSTGVSALSPNGTHVGVNLPGIFSLDLDTRGPGQGVRMSQSVLLGLVRVDLDRMNTSDGVMRGPVRVSVLGIPMYNNRQQLPTPTEVPATPDPRLVDDQSSESSVVTETATESFSNEIPRIPEAPIDQTDGQADSTSNEIPRIPEAPVDNQASEQAENTSDGTSNEIPRIPQAV